MPARRKSGWGGKRPGAGAKPLPPEKRRDERVMVRFTEKERKELEEAAGERTVSTFLRDLALRYLARRRRR